MFDDLNASERHGAHFFVRARTARVVLGTVHHELTPYVEPRALVATLVTDYYDRASVMDVDNGNPMLELAAEVLLATNPAHLRFTGTLDPLGDPRAQVAMLLGPWIKPEHGDAFFASCDDFLGDTFYMPKPDTMPAMLRAADHIRSQLPPDWLHAEAQPRPLVAAPPLPPVASLLRAVLASAIREEQLDGLLAQYADFEVTLPDGEAVPVIDLAVRIVLAVPRDVLRSTEHA